MMNNSKNMNGQFDRMRQLMGYGLNESKKQPYTGVEYHKVAADGKLYGIVREGTKFYIKVSSKKDNVLAENFEYIGGFRNRKDNEYSSFANAQKQFDLKMMSSRGIDPIYSLISVHFDLKRLDYGELFQLSQSKSSIFVSIAIRKRV